MAAGNGCRRAGSPAAPACCAARKRSASRRQTPSPRVSRTHAAPPACRADTSGTTGVPKGAVLTHSNIVANAGEWGAAGLGLRRQGWRAAPAAVAAHACGGQGGSAAHRCAERPAPPRPAPLSPAHAAGAALMLESGPGENLFRHGDRHIWCAARRLCVRRVRPPRPLRVAPQAVGVAGALGWDPTAPHLARARRPPPPPPASYLPLAHIYERFNFTLVTHYGAAAGFYRCGGARRAGLGCSSSIPCGLG